MDGRSRARRAAVRVPRAVRAHLAVAATALATAACGGAADRAAAPAVAPSPAPAASRQAAAVAGARVLVAIENDDRVAILGGAPRWRVLRRVRVPAGPHNVVASAALGLAAVTSPPAGRVTVLDARGRIRFRAAVSGSPHDAAFAQRGARGLLWVSAERAGGLVGLDARTGRVVRSLRTAAAPHDLAVSPDGRLLWVTLDGTAVVEIRDAGTGALLRRPQVGGAPHDVAFAPGGRRVWLSNRDSPTLTVATGGGRRVASLRAGAEPHHFAFGLGRLWASDNGGGRLLRVDPARRRIAGGTPVGPAPHHVATGGGAVLVAVNGSGDVAVVAPDGRRLRLVPVGAGPHGIDVLPARG